ncbi:MAG: carboxymuconolactone decarboxylase family protein [Candidatus Cyclobacteriaceae bacterium M3_2C_046]
MFRKRRYKHCREFVFDFKFLIRQRKELRKLQKGHLISPEFRQRLLMAVTVVNGCRYCTYYHSREALKAGLRAEELQKMLQGDLHNSPSEELPALLFAQHWAEQEGRADPELETQLKKDYGNQTYNAILLALKMIRFGNLSGNSFDYFLYRISGGKWGIS